jgi:hypothetical protein
MQFDALKARDDATWRAYCKLSDAADRALNGTAAHLEFAEAHAAITDFENPERFAQFAREAEAGEAAAAKPDQPAPVEHAEAPAASPRRPLDR